MASKQAMAAKQSPLNPKSIEIAQEICHKWNIDPVWIGEIAAFIEAEFGELIIENLGLKATLKLYKESLAKSMELRAERDSYKRIAENYANAARNHVDFIDKDIKGDE